MPLISAIVPVYNEEANVAALHHELREALNSLGTCEIIFINDGSTDGTLRALRSLPSIIIVDLRRNYGQAAALDAGFKIATGELVVSLDGDGQNDPRDIPRLIGHLRKNNLDVVAGWRTRRRDKVSIR
ncbi:MAG: glycosyltransferase, partial [Minisyncoccia bacterium]